MTTNTSSTRRPGQTKKTKTLQVAAEEHDIIDIPSENMHWLKKTVKSKVKEIKSRSTN